MMNTGFEALAKGVVILHALIRAAEMQAVVHSGLEIIQ